ncbi:hypothetical protein ACFS5L_12455 [Streptomyces phyllanthi]
MPADTVPPTAPVRLPAPVIAPVVAPAPVTGWGRTAPTAARPSSPC